MRSDALLFVGHAEGSDDALKEERNMQGFYRHMSTFKEGEFESILSKYFKKQESWKIEGANGRFFLNYLARK